MFTYGDWGLCHLQCLVSIPLCRMIPYRALSTGDKVGLIEVVTEAETIAKIQKKGGALSATAAFKKDAIFVWLKQHNDTPER